MKLVRSALLVLSTLAGATAFAADPDPASLYTLSTSVTPSTLKPGEKGTFVLAIQSKSGAHVSQEAPLKLELKGKNVGVEKSKLVMADSVVKPAAGQQYADPKFEVPVLAEAAGQGSVDAKLTFFICTDTICARQQKTLSVPVEVK